MTVIDTDPTKKRRQIQPQEWSTIGRLAAETDDLTKAEDRLLLALRSSGPSGSAATLRPTNYRELLSSVKLGVIGPREAKRFVDIPEARSGRWHQFRLRLQRGGPR